MPVTQIDGYNIAFNLNNKTIVGVTQDDLSISAQTKESITKDDDGVKNVAVTGHEITFQTSALFNLSGASGSVDRDDILQLALATGSSAKVPFTYSCAGGGTLTGNCIINSYSESTPADPDSDSTISISCTTTGDVTYTAATS